MPGYTAGVQRAWLLRLIGCLLALAAWGAAFAQITVPTLGTRGDVPQDVVDRLTAGLREGLAAEGLDVRVGELITAGIAGSLEPEFTRLIAEVDGSRYAVSGEVAEAGPDAERRYLVNLIAVEAGSDRTTDLISRPLGTDDVAGVAAALAAEIAAFAQPLGDLPRGDAGLFVSSEPRGARLSVDGVPVGTTPDVGPLMLAPGRYRIELRAEGFLPASRSVELRAGDTGFEHVVMTAISGGSIRVTSTPDARVRLDGERVGRTPLTVPARAGRHTIQLVRDGFAAEAFEVPVRTYRVTRVEGRLEPVREPLVYWAEERETLVRIDGRLQGQGFARDLEPGLRRIELIDRGERTEVLRAVPARGVFELDLDTGELQPRFGSPEPPPPE